MANPSKSNSNSQGFSLIEVVIVMGLLGILSMSFAALMTQGYTNQRGMQVKSTLQNLRNRIESSIRNQQSWYSFDSPAVNSTVEVNASPSPMPADSNMLSLINTNLMSPVVTADGYQLAVLMESAGAYTTDYVHNSAVLIDLNSNNSTSVPTSRGFDTNGQKCTTFGDPLTNCVFQFQVFWKPICPSGVQCQAPGVQYRADLKVTGGASALRGVQINPQSWGIAWTTRNDPNYLANFCNSLLGHWNGTSCDFTGLDGACGQDERLQGFVLSGAAGNQTAQRVCEPILKGLDTASAGCGPGKKMEGVDANGVPICTFNLNGADTSICPDGEKVVRVDGYGNRICARNLSGAQTTSCPSGKVASIDDKGNVSCKENIDLPANVRMCATGQKVRMINADGSVVCENNIDVATRMFCNPNEVVVGANSDGTPICRPKQCQDTREITVNPPSTGNQLMVFSQRWSCPDLIDDRDPNEAYRWYVDDIYLDRPDGYCQEASSGLRASVQCIYSGNPGPRTLYVRCCVFGT